MQSTIWPLLVVALGLIALLQALEVFPPAIADLLGRAWPLALVFVGLAILLDQPQRLRRWAWLLALVVSAALLAGVIFVAYTLRAGTDREDNVVTFVQEVEADVTRLHVVIESGETAVEILPSVRETPTLTAAFTGSTESRVETDYQVAAGVATFTLRETRPNPIPMLEAVGRGRLTVELPLGVPVALDFRNANGAVSLNLIGLELVSLDVEIAAGGLLLSLPESQLEARGRVIVSRGDVTVFVPDELGLRLLLNRAPQYPEDDYRYLADGSLESRLFDTAAIQNEITLTAGGAVRVE